MSHPGFHLVLAMNNVIHGGDDEDGVAVAAERLAEQRAEFVLGADEMDADIVLAGSENSPANLGFGGLVGTHRVYNDVNRHQRDSSRV